VRLVLDRAWDGEPVDSPVEVEIRPGRAGLELGCAAPLAGAGGPPGPPGPTPRLWEHEVVELFVLGADGHYLEVELGPFGNHLVLQLRARREVAREGLPLRWRSRIAATASGRRWGGRATIPWAYLPTAPHRFNLYAIQPWPGGRRFLALFSVPGAEPDFHRLESFRPVDFCADFLPDPLPSRSSAPSLRPLVGSR
jgi:hypothetical protein